MKILFVDDEERVRDLLIHLLENNGFDVISASNGLEAMEKFVVEKPEIVISDVRMPKMDGIELLTQIKQSELECEVIIISAHSDFDNALASLRLGAANFIRKPIDARELTHIVEQVKEKIDLKQENRNYRDNLEKLVEAKTEKLMESERYAVLGRHSAHLAHNLNSSLTGVLGCIQLLDIKITERNETIDKYINTIQDSALKMRDTIGNTLIRVRKNHNSNEVMLSINEVIDGQIKMFKTHSVVDKSVTFTTELTSTLPSISGIYSDFTQIFDNLISNAIDAMEDCKSKEVIISTYYDKSSISFEVSDTGCGIPQDICENIFNPHFTTKELGKGTGLGLASVKELLENYKATIDVTSEIDKGTTFKVVIPHIVKNV